MLNPPLALLPATPSTVCKGISSTGTAYSHIFSIVSKGRPNKVTCQAIGAFTVLDGSIEASLNAADWSFLHGFDFVATPIIILEPVEGTLYRFNVSNLTETVAPDIIASLG